jgi:hypothetical protein
MRYCDRCKATPVFETFHGSRDHGEIDLCKPCRESLDEWLKPAEEAKNPDAEDIRPKMRPKR